MMFLCLSTSEVQVLRYKSQLLIRESQLLSYYKGIEKGMIPPL